MGVFYHVLLGLHVLFIVLHISHCATLLVDGLTQWSFPTANIGDTIIFKHKNEYNLYIFRSKEAYETCNFTLATPLSKPNSTTYTWHPSRPGKFYFAFNNGTTKPCEQGQKVAVTIDPLSNSPAPSINPPEVTPPTTPAGAISPSPAYPWPFEPREKADGPVSADGSSPTGLPGSIPFINSNPAVPLPTGEVDSATISPLPTPANHSPQGVKALGMINGLISLIYVILVTM